MLISTQSRWKLTPLKAQTRDEVLAECERVMEALLDIEREEGHVSSPAVSVDLGSMIVIINLAAEAQDLDSAEKLVEDAIDRAVERGKSQIARRSELVERHAELIPA